MSHERLGKEVALQNLTIETDAAGVNSDWEGFGNFVARNETCREEAGESNEANLFDPDSTLGESPL
jgi:hypothetical protein